MVLPRDAQQVQELVKLANTYGMPVYPRSFGGNIAASPIPYQGGIVIDRKRMDRIHLMESMAATIEPGVSWGKLTKRGEPKGPGHPAYPWPLSKGRFGEFSAHLYNPPGLLAGKHRQVEFFLVHLNDKVGHHNTCPRDAQPRDLVVHIGKYGR